MPLLPDQGVGIVYFPALEPLLKAGSDVIDVLEIEPQHYWIKQPGHASEYRLDERAFERIQQWPQQKLVHGVGIPVGGSLPLDERQLDPFIESINRIQPAWVSEHLAFLRAAGGQQAFNTGFLLPPLQTVETVRTAAANIRTLQTHIRLPFAFENAANYLKPKTNEIPDGEFLASVAEEADCGILLDLHNLWCNQKNGRQSVREVLASLPLERIWEVHLAGGDELNGYWLDAHSGLVPEELLAICADWFPRLPNLKAVMFEVIPDYLAVKDISIEQLHAQLHVLKQLWNTRGSRMPMTYTHALGTAGDRRQLSAPALTEYEHALAKLVNRRPPKDALQIELASDPGVEVLQNLVTSVRAGMLVDLLTLSYRLMVLNLGEQAVRELMDDYWRETLPEPFAAEEAKRFATFVKQQNLTIPHLPEVLAYEVASIEYLSTGHAAKVNFSCDPRVLLSALHTGKLPEQLPAGRFQVAVTQ